MIQRGARPVVELFAKTPAEGLKLPYAKGEAQLSEVPVQVMTSIAPFKGKEAEVAAALGTGLPKVGRTSGKSGEELAWFSQGQFLLIGPECPGGLEAAAAITDQSDAWCVLSLKGATAEDVLARLVPVDLRQAQFKRGHCLRSQLNHMQLHITRTGNDSFRLMCFRSMAGTMVHELSRAMELLAGRG